MILSLILGFAIGAGAIIFILQNTSIVALTFLGWQFESSLAIVVMLAILIGIVFSLLASIPSAINSTLMLSKLRKENRNLQEETEKYRHAANEAAARFNATVQATRDTVE